MKAHLSMSRLAAALAGASFCISLPGQVQLVQPQPSVIGGSVQLRASGATPGALVFAGLSLGLQQPPWPSPFGGVHLAAPITSLPLGVANVLGIATAGFAVPNDPGCIGARLYAQGLDIGSLR